MPSPFATELFVKLFGVMPPDRKRQAAAPKAPNTQVLVPNRPAAAGEKVIYHVTPRQDERWNIRKEGGARPSAVCQNKDEAIERAREIAKNLPWSQIVIHNKDGKISGEYEYGGPPGSPARIRKADEEWEAEETDRGFEMTDVPTQREKRVTAKVNKDEVPAGKATRVIYHVTPRAEDGMWRVKRQGSSRPTRVISKKEDAIEAAKVLAKNRGKGQVVIHNKDGRIAEEFKYDS